MHVFNALKIETHLNYVQKFICTPRITICISLIHTGRLITFRGTIIIHYGNHRCIIKTSRCLNSQLLILQQVARIFTTVLHASESLSSGKEVRRPNWGLLHFHHFRQRPQLMSRLTTRGHWLPLHSQWKILATEGGCCLILRVPNNRKAFDKEIRRDDIRGIPSTIQLIIHCPSIWYINL